MLGVLRAWCLGLGIYGLGFYGFRALGFRALGFRVLELRGSFTAKGIALGFSIAQSTVRVHGCSIGEEI